MAAKGSAKSAKLPSKNAAHVSASVSEHESNSSRKRKRFSVGSLDRVVVVAVLYFLFFVYESTTCASTFSHFSYICSLVSVARRRKKLDVRKTVSRESSSVYNGVSPDAVISRFGFKFLQTFDLLGWCVSGLDNLK